MKFVELSDKQRNLFIDMEYINLWDLYVSINFEIATALML